MEPNAGNATLAPETPDNGISAPMEPEADAGALEASGATDGGDNGEGSFWNGDPTTLAPDLKAAYDEMNRGLQAKFRDVADMRKSLQAELEEARSTREAASRQSLEWQARLSEMENRGASESNQMPTTDELRQQFNEAAQSGRGFEAMLELIDKRTGIGAKSVVSERESALMEKIQALEQNLQSVQSSVQPMTEMQRMDTAFRRMSGTGGAYRELNNAKVREHFDKELRAGDPVVSHLLSLGDDSSVEAALALVAERAIRKAEAGRMVSTATRRGDATPPASRSGTSSPGLKPKDEYDDGFERFQALLMANDPDLRSRLKGGGG